MDVGESWSSFWAKEGEGKALMDDPAVDAFSAVVSIALFIQNVNGEDAVVFAPGEIAIGSSARPEEDGIGPCGATVGAGADNELIPSFLSESAGGSIIGTGKEEKAVRERGARGDEGQSGVADGFWKSGIGMDIAKAGEIRGREAYEPRASGGVAEIAVNGSIR